MASISGEFSVVHYFDAEKNELMFARFWVNGHEVHMKNIEQKRRMKLFVEKALSMFKNVLYWNSGKNSFSTNELKYS